MRFSHLEDLYFFNQSHAPPQRLHLRVMAVVSPQVELLISFFFSDDDVNFLNMIMVLKLCTLTPLTQDSVYKKDKNRANNLIGDHMLIIYIRHHGEARGHCRPRLTNFDTATFGDI